MELAMPNCSYCRYWEPILTEGSAGCPQKPVLGQREGWGQCQAAPHSQALVRIKGILETKHSFWCTAYVPREEYKLGSS